MQRFSIAPQEVVARVWNDRQLTLSLIKREVLGRYKGSVLGLLWSLFNPLLMLMVYTFVFSVILNARWRSTSESRTEFALVLFAGLLVFNFFSECVNKAPGILLANASYVKKVVFPLEILPLVPLGSALFHTGISMGVWLIFYLALFGLPPATFLIFPFIMLPLLLVVMGLSWLLASLGVYLRDVSQVTGIVTAALLFLSPIFYSSASVPQGYQVLLQLNPLSAVIEQTRDVLIWGKVPDIIGLARQVVMSAFLAWVGFAWFQKTRKGFADVL